MQKILFLMIHIVIIAILIICAKMTKKDMSGSKKHLWKVLVSAVYATTGAVLVLMADDYFVAVFGYSVYWVSLDWVCYTLVDYTYALARYEKKNEKVGKVFKTLCVADSISILLNMIWGHVAAFNPTDYGGNIYYTYEVCAGFIIHLMICYILIAMSLGILIWGMIKSSSVFRSKYVMILSAVAVAVLINASSAFYRSWFDKTTISFAIIAIVITYCSVYYIPKKLRSNVQSILLDQMTDGVILFDDINTCIYKNPKAEEWFGTELNTLDEFKQNEYFSNVIQNNGSIIIDGKKRHYNIEYIVLDDEKGRYSGCFYIFHDMTTEREMRKKQHLLATRDQLTNVFNRNTFFERTAVVLQKNPDKPYYIICSDIKQFKRINEIFGEEVGNTFLKLMADNLKKLGSENTVYGRVGGDSFAVCMPKEDFDAKLFIGSAQYKVNMRLHIVVHLGIYEVKDHFMPVSMMCDRAMIALGEIRETYQSVVSFYDEAMEIKRRHDQEILDDIQNAFDDDQFVIYLQPQVNHRTQEIVGTEALVRWLHPKKGLLAPGEFIPLLESRGMISMLDKHVWKLACRQLRKWKDEGKEHLSISVNISTKDFYYEDLYEVFTGLIEEYQISEKNLKLEITESAFAIDEVKQIETVEKLQKAGFVIEMDDFGSGYSSLNTLKNTPVDVIKMDMAFMSGKDIYKRGADILQMVVSMAQRLNMPIIAEGVETLEQAEFLSEIGCDIIQGYFYQKPCSVEEFEAILDKYEKEGNTIQTK